MTGPLHTPVIRWSPKSHSQAENEAFASTKPERCSNFFWSILYSNQFKLNHLNYTSMYITIPLRHTNTDVCMGTAPAKTLVCPPSIPSCSSCMTTAALTLPNHIRHLKSPGSPLPITGENKNCNAAFLFLTTAPSSSL